MRVLTAIEIGTNHQNGDIMINAGQDKNTKKWTSFMYLMRDGGIHKLMLSFDITEKFEGFDTEELAIAEMERLRDSAIEYCKEKGFVK
jgi:hypothetical protein